MVPLFVCFIVGSDKALRSFKKKAIAGYIFSYTGLKYYAY